MKIIHINERIHRVRASETHSGYWAIDKLMPDGTWRHHSDGLPSEQFALSYDDAERKCGPTTWAEQIAGLKRTCGAVEWYGKTTIAD